MITRQNADRVRDLVSPAKLYKVNQGMSMKIIPTWRLDWPPPFEEATEKYSSQVPSLTIIDSVEGEVLIRPNGRAVG